MYIAINRFQIVLGKENDFEILWKERDTHLDQVPGFLEFHLIKGEKKENYTLYASHSTWDTKNDFLNWTKSEAFRRAHKDAGNNGHLYIGHPVFEGFDVVV